MLDRLNAPADQTFLTRASDFFVCAARAQQITSAAVAGRAYFTFRMGDSSATAGSASAKLFARPGQARAGRMGAGGNRHAERKATSVVRTRRVAR